MINWMFFPKNEPIFDDLKEVVQVFEKNNYKISSDRNSLKSNEVLKTLEKDLMTIGYVVEHSKNKEDKIRRPVLYGMNGKEELSFEADGYCEKTKTVIEVEAGRAVVNYQFLKDFYQACMMIDADRLCIAVRNKYIKSKDFKKVCDFFEAMYSSNRIQIPLKGLLIIGY